MVVKTWDCQMNVVDEPRTNGLYSARLSRPARHVADGAMESIEVVAPIFLSMGNSWAFKTRDA